MRTGHKRYKITAEFTVNVKHNALVVQHPESVAAAVRQYLRVHLPVAMTKGGYAFDTGTIFVEAETQGEQANV
jgi:hypothetical protein